jgi:hypothetical protein
MRLPKGALMSITLALLSLCAFSCGHSNDVNQFNEATLRLIALHQSEQDAASSRKMPFGFLSIGHDVSAGKGRVIQLKQKHWSTKSPDANYTEELSIYVPEGEPKDVVVDLADKTSGIVAFYSTFSDAFEGNSGCFGYAREGTLSIRTVHEAVVVTITSLLPTRDPIGLGAKCNEVRLDGRYKVTRQSTP